MKGKGRQKLHTDGVHEPEKPDVDVAANLPEAEAPTRLASFLFFLSCLKRFLT